MKRNIRDRQTYGPLSHRAAHARLRSTFAPSALRSRKAHGQKTTVGRIRHRVDKHPHAYFNRARTCGNAPDVYEKKVRPPGNKVLSARRAAPIHGDLRPAELAIYGGSPRVRRFCANRPSSSENVCIRAAMSVRRLWTKTAGRCAYSATRWWKKNYDANVRAYLAFGIGWSFYGLADAEKVMKNSLSAVSRAALLRK